MTVGVGVIGTGMIGADHVRRLSRALHGAQVLAVSDVEQPRAAAVAEQFGVPTVYRTGEQLIAAGEVDAVLVCSWGPTHEQYVLDCIAAGKSVFCEKPLATTAEACQRIIAAEVERGHRVVQVGYMRRYDPAYRTLAQVVAGGVIGRPLLMHAVHRNASVPGFYPRESVIVDTGVHDIDVARWLLAEEIVAVRVLTPRRNRNGGDLPDPLLLVLESASGVLVDVEISVNIRYGYDIRGEVVGEHGTVSLPEPAGAVLRHQGTASAPVPADWQERFAVAYDVELQEWVDGLAAGVPPTGPSSWDGHAVTAVAEAALVALDRGERVEVVLPPRPALYAS